MFRKFSFAKIFSRSLLPPYRSVFLLSVYPGCSYSRVQKRVLRRFPLESPPRFAPPPPSRALEKSDRVPPPPSMINHQFSFFARSEACPFGPRAWSRRALLPRHINPALFSSCPKEPTPPRDPPVPGPLGFRKSFSPCPGLRWFRSLQCSSIFPWAPAASTFFHRLTSQCALDLNCRPFSGRQ